MSMNGRAIRAGDRVVATKDWLNVRVGDVGTVTAIDDEGADVDFDSVPSVPGFKAHIMLWDELAAAPKHGLVGEADPY